MLNKIKFQNILKATLPLLAGIIIAGCSTIPQGITPSSSPLITENGTARSYDVLGTAEGSAGHFTLFGFIPFGKSDIDEAIQEAISKYNGDNLINVHYNIKSVFYLIGSYTSIKVYGDVIKYRNAGEVENKITGYNESSEAVDNTNIKQPRATGYKSNHKLTIGSAVDGFAADYTMINPVSDFLYYSFSIGYKNYSKTDSWSYGYYNYDSSYTRYSYSIEHSIDAIPVAINFGINAGKLISIPYPINPYASIGVAYIPYSDGGFEFNQVGFNFNIGADYRFTNNIGVGLDYRYIKSVNETSGFIDNAGLGFSNLNVSVVYYP